MKNLTRTNAPAYFYADKDGKKVFFLTFTLERQKFGVKSERIFFETDKVSSPGTSPQISNRPRNVRLFDRTLFVIRHRQG